MPSKNPPSVETLARVLRYDPETGRLFWLPRTPDMFTATKTRTKEHMAAWWNSKYAGRDAITSDNGQGYRRSRVLGFDLLAHRVAWALVHGHWPDHPIDHINGYRNDNRACNLRAATAQTNQWNKRPSSASKSGLKGAHDNGKGKWRSSIFKGGVKHNLGTFDNSADAAKAYAAKAAQMFGEFAFSVQEGEAGNAF